MLRAVFLAALVLSVLQAECVRVEGAHITAADLAKASGEFAKLDPSLVFSFAPVVGAQRTVSSVELEKWASSHGLIPAPVSSACFERSSYQLRQDDVADALKAAINPALENLRIDVVEICPCTVPPGRLEFNLRGTSLPPSDHPETPVLWRGRLIGTDGRVYPLWARVRVFAAITVVRATANLRTRQILADGDLELFKMFASPLRFSQPATLAAYNGKVLKVSVPRGTILEPNMVDAPSDVERGSLVRVEVLDGGARLVLRARAETAGNRGDLVILTNPAGAARFPATVTGPGHAEISLLAERVEIARPTRGSRPNNAVLQRSF